jgi:TPR repeat protein
MATKQGFATAQYNLDVIYDQGDGVLQDLTEAYYM